MRGSLVICLLLCTAGCGPDPLYLTRQDSGHSHSATAGQEIRIRLVAFATGYHVESISSSAVRFIKSEAIPPYLPSGPDLLFTFEAVHSGSAEIRIGDMRDDLFIYRIDVR